MKETLVAEIPENLVLELTGQLVAIPTPNPPGREKALAEFVADTLTGWGIETELVPEPEPSRPQVVAWLRGTGVGPTLILNAHMDTVGPGERDNWEFEPFQATRRGNRLYGLGTCDM